MPSVDLVQQLPLVDLIEEILVAKTEDFASDVTKLEGRLDQRIFELYHLTTQEIENIEISLEKTIVSLMRF